MVLANLLTGNECAGEGTTSEHSRTREAIGGDVQVDNGQVQDRAAAGVSTQGQGEGDKSQRKEVRGHP